MSVYNTRLWLFLEDYVYYQPRQPRVRAKDRPLQVIAVGPVRSATESLQHALIQLGYEHTYHGWDLLFEERHNMRGWAKLARRKFLGTANSGGDCDITAADFDELMGDAVAVCDIPASVFAAEMIRAYPDAKVIINTNPDLDRWHASAEKNVVAVNRSWFIYLMSWTMKDWFWAWTSCERFLLPGLFRCVGQSLDLGVMGNGKWIYREHCAMVRGLVQEEGRLLEWTAEDGWEPLCTFLQKPIPDEPFPRVNNAVGFQGRIEKLTKRWLMEGLRNLAIGIAILVVVLTVIWKM